MKKFISAVLVLALAFSVAACSKSGGSKETNAPAATAKQGQAADGDEGGSGSGNSAGKAGGITGKSAHVAGKLYSIGDPVIKGLALSGNRSGSSEFNSKDPSTEGIRCVFELNEYVEFRLDTDVNKSIEVWVITHGAYDGDYAEAKFSEEMNGYRTKWNLEKNAEAGNWGEFYLHNDENPAGAYDFVFVIDGKAVAVFATQFYKEPELEEKTDEELGKLVSGF